MTRVRAFSRLHFGVLNLGVSPERHFGGVGLMVCDPGLLLHVRPAAEWSASGPLAARALEFARRFAESAPDAARPQQIAIEYSGPEHAGLGTGTQLGLAVARALAAAWGLNDLDATGLARRVGRGRRSGLGVHGFAQGGFLVEAGKHSPEAIAPLVARAEFPKDWRLVLALPPGETGLHGTAESRAFEELNRLRMPPARADVLCRLVLLGLLPALAERDLPAFGAALYEFNRLVGETFAPVQGGIYAGPRLEELVAFLRQQGVRGVAQSSWGPAMCAVVEDAERAAELVGRLRQHFALSPAESFATAACNHRASLEHQPEA